MTHKERKNASKEAKKKPIKKLKPSDLGVDLAARIEVLKVTEPPTRAGGVKVESVDEMIEKLKAAGVLS